MDHEVETIIAWRSLLSLQLPTLVIGGVFVHLGVLGLAKNSGSCMQSVTTITNRNSADSIDKAVGMHYDHLL
jgi:hypothetical protein